MNLIPDLTIIPMWFVFMMSFFVLNHFIFKPTLKILAERRNKTIGLEKDVKNFEEKTEVNLREYGSLMVDANNLARNARDDILRAADSQQKEIVGEARQEAEQKINQIKAKISEQSGKAQQELQQNSQQLAQEIASKLMERKVA